mmetsp:Transcript_43723/g.132370  ORF Transcript_43723/g.132370 Transcript_43723/m.132370 type:complete len:239 (-) Transcript_43723:87-803(-)
MPMPAKKQQGMSKQEALSRIGDLEDPAYIEHQETYVLAVKAMNALPEDHEVQAKGCWGLALGAVSHSRYILAAGGAQAVIAAMTAFLSDDRLQAEACETLRYLAEKKDGQQIILDAGGIKAILAAAEAHGQDEQGRVPQEALGALTKLAARDAARVLDAGGLDQVLRVADLFPSYSWVQVWCCQAMKEFSLHDHRRIEAVEGYDKIQEIMGAMKKEEAVQLFGREAMLTKPVVLSGSE